MLHCVINCHGSVPNFEWDEESVWVLFVCVCVCVCVVCADVLQRAVELTANLKADVSQSKQKAKARHLNVPIENEASQDLHTVPCFHWSVGRSPLSHTHLLISHFQFAKQNCLTPPPPHTHTRTHTGREKHISSASENTTSTYSMTWELQHKMLGSAIRKYHHLDQNQKMTVRSAEL